MSVSKELQELLDEKRKLAEKGNGNDHDEEEKEAMDKDNGNDDEDHDDDDDKEDMDEKKKDYKKEGAEKGDSVQHTDKVEKGKKPNIKTNTDDKEGLSEDDIVALVQKKKLPKLEQAALIKKIKEGKMTRKEAEDLIAQVQSGKLPNIEKGDEKDDKKKLDEEVLTEVKLPSDGALTALFVASKKNQPVKISPVKKELIKMGLVDKGGKVTAEGNELLKDKKAKAKIKELAS